MSINSSFQNDSFTDKKEGTNNRERCYKNGCYSEMDVSTYPDWNIETIKERGIEETSENLFNAAANVANLILEDNKKISSMLNNITALNQINDETISSLLHSGNIKDQSSLKILENQFLMLSFYFYKSNSISSSFNILSISV